MGCLKIGPGRVLHYFFSHTTILSGSPGIILGATPISGYPYMLSAATKLGLSCRPYLPLSRSVLAPHETR